MVMVRKLPHPAVTGFLGEGPRQRTATRIGKQISG